MNDIIVLIDIVLVLIALLLPICHMICQIPKADSRADSKRYLKIISKSFEREVNQDLKRKTIISGKG